MTDSNANPLAPEAAPAAPGDARLYVPDAEHWQVRIMTGAEREYCYQQNPGEDYYHLIVPGEMYLQSGAEKLCLNCALRRGVAVADRLFWQVRRG